MGFGVEIAHLHRQPQNALVSRHTELIKIELCRLILERFDNIDAIAGVATGAIAQGALIAEQLGLPYVYVRSAPKDHGLENLIEGNLIPGQRVVVIEDLISTGGSSLKAVEAIRNVGCEVVGMAAYFPTVSRSRGTFQDCKCRCCYPQQLRSRIGSRH